eukprot:3479012-Pyramimonas_sp.AAC.1
MEAQGRATNKCSTCDWRLDAKSKQTPSAYFQTGTSERGARATTEDANKCTHMPDVHQLSGDSRSPLAHSEPPSPSPEESLWNESSWSRIAFRVPAAHLGRLALLPSSLPALAPALDAAALEEAAPVDGSGELGAAEEVAAHADEDAGDDKDAFTCAESGF